MIPVDVGGVADPAPRVQPDHEVVLGGGPQQRPVADVAPGDVGADGQQDLHDLRVAPDPVDLGDGRLGVERRHHHARAQPLVAIEPLRRQPVVDRPRERGLVVRVAVAVERRGAGQHGDAHARAGRAPWCAGRRRCGPGTPPRPSRPAWRWWAPQAGTPRPARPRATGHRPGRTSASTGRGRARGRRARRARSARRCRRSPWSRAAVIARRPLRKPVEPARVRPHDLTPQRRREQPRGLPRGVEVPVRVVGGEQDAVVHPDVPQRGGQVGGVVRLLDRLRGEPEVLADVLRRRPAQVRHVRAQLPPGVVEGPHQRTGPGDAALDADHLQRRELARTPLRTAC